MRYRKPSLKTVLGITKAKRQLKKNLGLSGVSKLTNPVGSLKRQAKRSVGYESEPMKLFRFLGRLFKA
jgi:hypothetical protein